MHACLHTFICILDFGLNETVSFQLGCWNWNRSRLLVCLWDWFRWAGLGHVFVLPYQSRWVD